MSAAPALRDEQATDQRHLHRASAPVSRVAVAPAAPHMRRREANDRERHRRVSDAGTDASGADRKTFGVIAATVAVGDAVADAPYGVTEQSQPDDVQRQISERHRANFFDRVGPVCGAAAEAGGGGRGHEASDDVDDTNRD